MVIWVYGLLLHLDVVFWVLCLVGSLINSGAFYSGKSVKFYIGVSLDFSGYLLS